MWKLFRCLKLVVLRILKRELTANHGNFDDPVRDKEVSSLLPRHKVRQDKNNNNNNKIKNPKHNNRDPKIIEPLISFLILSRGNVCYIYK